jgi:hypothetical protein
MTLDTFTARFVAKMIRLAGPAFLDGTPVGTYARAAARFYWIEPLCREQGPEACAEDDFLALEIEAAVIRQEEISEAIGLQFRLK